jgi:hypothetical protein
MRIVCIFAVLLAIFGPVRLQAQHRRLGDQSTFTTCADPTVRVPVLLTPSELLALANDDLMQQERDQDPPISAYTGQGLEAAVVHLLNSHEQDLIVIGSGRPFLGANVCPFWIIRDLPTGPIVMLHTLTLSLQVQASRTHSLRDISTSSANASTNTTTIFHFNGKEYVPARSRTRPNGS